MCAGTTPCCCLVEGYGSEEVASCLCSEVSWSCNNAAHCLLRLQVLVPAGTLAARHRWAFAPLALTGLWFQVHRAVQVRVRPQLDAVPGPCIAAPPQAAAASTHAAPCCSTRACNAPALCVAAVHCHHSLTLLSHAKGVTLPAPPGPPGKRPRRTDVGDGADCDGLCAALGQLRQHGRRSGSGAAACVRNTRRRIRNPWPLANMTHNNSSVQASASRQLARAAPPRQARPLHLCSAHPPSPALCTVARTPFKPAMYTSTLLSLAQLRARAMTTALRMTHSWRTTSAWPSPSSLAWGCMSCWPCSGDGCFLLDVLDILLGPAPRVPAPCTCGNHPCESSVIQAKPVNAHRRAVGLKGGVLTR